MLDRWTGAAILAAMTVLPTPPADAAAPVRFACTVAGAGKYAPALTSQAICARAQARVDKTLTGGTRQVAVLPESPSDKSGWVRIDVQVKPRGVVSATLTSAAGGRVVTRPEITMALSDRAVGLDTIDRLIAEAMRHY